MTLGFRFLSVLFFAAGSLIAFDASAAAVKTLTASSAFARNYNVSDEAEICDSYDGRYRSVRVFTSPYSFFVEFGADPTVQPEVKEGYAHVQEAGGSLEQSPVSLEMFELMAEPFGGVEKPREQWKSAFEKVYVGQITVYDQTGTLVVSFAGQCNTAVVEFK